MLVPLIGIFLSATNPEYNFVRIPVEDNALIAEVGMTISTSSLLYEIFDADAPIMVEVAQCESTSRQFNSDGSVLRGREVKEDVGFFQINETYNLKEATDHGIDIYTLRGNMEMAKRLFDEHGLTPWSSSKPCWKDRIPQYRTEDPQP